MNYEKFIDNLVENNLCLPLLLPWLGSSESEGLTFLTRVLDLYFDPYHSLALFMFCCNMAALLLLFALSFALSVDGAEIRGVAPSKMSRYRSGSEFTCLDGSATIPISYVNDDYCDCK